MCGTRSITLWSVLLGESYSGRKGTGLDVNQFITVNKQFITVNKLVHNINEEMIYASPLEIWVQ